MFAGHAAKRGITCGLSAFALVRPTVSHPARLFEIAHNPCPQNAMLWLPSPPNAESTCPLLRTKHLVRPLQIAQVPVYQPSADLGLRHMDQVTLHSVVQIIRVHNIALQQTTLRMPDLP